MASVARVNIRKVEMIEGKAPGNLPVYRRWWFWVALALIVLVVASLLTNVADRATDVSKPGLPVPEAR